MILRSSAYLLMLGALVPACASDDAVPITGVIETTNHDGARVVRGAEGRLTAPSDAPPVEVALAMFDGRAVGTLREAAVRDGAGGAHHVAVEQHVAGLRVIDGYARVAVSADGAVEQVIEHLVDEGPVAPARVDRDAALTTVLAALGYDGAAPVATRRDGEVTTYQGIDGLEDPPEVERVAYAAADGGLATGYQVRLWVTGVGLSYTLVSGDGQVLRRSRRTSQANYTGQDRYRVFPEDPLKGQQRLVNGPGDPGPEASPDGWLRQGYFTASPTTMRITGNNARAGLDSDATPDQRDSPPDEVDLNFGTEFLAVADLTKAPSVGANRAVAVQNAFYLVNRAHDVLWTAGFREADGNFQELNFGRGGRGRDLVRVDAQDRLLPGNAQFTADSRDGVAPRLELGLFDGNPPRGEVVADDLVWPVHLSLLPGAAASATVTATGVVAKLALMDDGTGVKSDGCEPAVVPLTGRIALIDRGRCLLTVKLRNAQAAGAVAALVVNNVGGESTQMSGDGDLADLTIPSGVVARADGDVLKQRLGRTHRFRLTSTPPLVRDSALDADIVFHEYAHGLTWRVVGDLDGVVGLASGEGLSDVFAFAMNGDDRIGEYAWHDGRGLRRAPYKDYPLTYAAMRGADPHADGEILAAAMWRVRQIYIDDGLTRDALRDTFLADWVESLKRAPARPSFEQLRDALLAVVTPARQCRVWAAFAAYGIGVGAKVVVDADGNPVVTESTRVPARCR